LLLHDVGSQNKERALWLALATSLAFLLREIVFSSHSSVWLINIFFVVSVDSAFRAVRCAFFRYLKLFEYFISFAFYRLTKDKIANL